MKKSLFGYDPKQVKQWLDELREDHVKAKSALEQEVIEMKAEIEELHQEIEELKRKKPDEAWEQDLTRELTDAHLEQTKAILKAIKELSDIKNNPAGDRLHDKGSEEAIQRNLIDRLLELRSVEEKRRREQEG